MSQPEAGARVRRLNRDIVQIGTLRLGHQADAQARDRPVELRAWRIGTACLRVLARYPTRGLPTISFAVPTYWTPEQALAVVELLDDLRNAIWGFYDLQLIDLIREQRMTAAGELPVDTSDDKSF